MVDTSVDYVALRAELIRDEARRKFAYDDKTGAPPKLQGNLTIGIGHNLTANGLSDAVIEFIYQEDVDIVVHGLNKNLNWFAALDGVRKRAMINFCFNLGVQKVLNEFQPTLRLIALGDYGAASDHMLASKWASDVGPRAQRVANQMRDGR